jgi:uncharacterized iron-regulated protein
MTPAAAAANTVAHKAVGSQSREAERSCFSNDTHRTTVANSKGFQSVWTGEFKLRDSNVPRGTDVRDLVAGKNPTEEQLVSRALKQFRRYWVAQPSRVRPSC